MEWNLLYDIGDVVYLSLLIVYCSTHVSNTMSYIVLVCIPMSGVHPRERAIVGRFLLKQVE